MKKNKIFLIILSVVLVLMVFDWLYVMNLFATIYERNDVTANIEKYFDELKSENYEMIPNIYEYDKTTYSEEDLINFVTNMYGDISDINVSMKSDNNAETESFEIYNAEDKYISTMIATKTSANDLFNINVYELSSNDLDEYNNPTIRVPEIISEVYINDTKFDTILESNYIDIYDELDKGKLKPKYNIISLGELAVLNENFIFVNDSYDYEVEKTSNNTFEVVVRPNEENQKFYTDIVTDTTKTYIKYVAKDTSLYSLRKLLYKYSSYYDLIATYNNYWYSDHSSYRFENISVTDTKIYSSKHFSASISLDYIVNSYGGEHTIKSEYTLYFIKENDKWLCTLISLK